MIEPLRKNEVRLFFSTGRVVELKFPVASTKGAKIVSGGLGLDPGDGFDLCAVELHKQRGGKVWLPGSWV